MSHTPSAQTLTARAAQVAAAANTHFSLSSDAHLQHCDAPLIEVLATVTADLARRVAELEERLARHEAAGPALARRE